MADILAIGAHMGDEIAWGAALAAHQRQGHSIGILHLTPGEKGHKSLSAGDYAQQKRIEATQAAQILGAHTWMLNYGDGELPVDDRIKWEIADVIREARPKVVLTHWRGSMHKDHTAAHLNLSDSIFFAALPAFKRPVAHHSVSSVYYGENWEDLREYVPEVFLELKKADLECWEHAMRSYALFRGEVAAFRYLDYYKALFASRGCEAGFEYACTFSVPPESHRKKTGSLL